MEDVLNQRLSQSSISDQGADNVSSIGRLEPPRSPVKNHTNQRFMDSRETSDLS